MTFAWPHMLLLAAVPVGLILYFARRAGRSVPRSGRGFPNIRRGLADRGRLLFRPDARRPWRFPWRFWLGFLLIIVALARPQWGRGQEATYSAAGEVLIALDLSRSMLVKDVEPARLDRARTLANELIAALPDQKIGLIAFAGTAHLLAPAKDDRAILTAFLPALNPQHVIDQGTDLAELLALAGSAFSDQAAQRRLVILSDGEAEASAWRDRLAELRGKGVRVIAIGLGTSGGGVVPGANGKPLEDELGVPVLSRLNPTILGEIAERTGGAYLEEARTADIAELVKATQAVEDVAGSASGGGADQFAWFLSAALLLLAWSARSEWLARPKIRRFRTPSANLAAIALILLLVDGAFRPRVAVADATSASSLDLHEEEDPLTTVTETVSRLLTKAELGAGDYLEFASTATRYGEVHRGLAKPLSEGVLRDALVAIGQGRRLDPSLREWDTLQATLKRLLVPPPPVPEDGSSPPDAANEPVDAEREAPVAGSDQEQQEGDSREAEGSPASGQGLQSVGGSRRDTYDPAEWGDSSLAEPLYKLGKIRDSGSPAELFRLMQLRSARPPRETRQLW